MAFRNLSTASFLKQLRIYARKNNLFFDIKKNEGKGSHQRVYVGDRKTTAPRRKDLDVSIVRDILRQLRIDPDNLDS